MQIKLIAYGVAVLAVLAALVYGGVHFYNSGYGAASAKYEAQIAKIQADAAQKLTEEIQRQQAANRDAKQHEADALAKIEAAQAENDKLKKELENAANNDPNANNVVLDPSSVQRINKVR